MIDGAKYWNDRTCYHVQTNNPTEEQLRKAKLASFLETCGGSAAANCCCAIRGNIEIKCPGGFILQNDEVAADYLNDKRNYDKFRGIRPDLNPEKIQGNRVPQYYPVMAREVFKVRAEYFDRLFLPAIAKYLASGAAIQICLQKPGHYLAVVARDAVTDELIYHDSWPARVGGDGFCKRMGRPEFLQNTKPFCVVYWPD
jgi:hypothetical protein